MKSDFSDLLQSNNQKTLEKIRSQKANSFETRQTKIKKYSIEFLSESYIKISFKSIKQSQISQPITTRNNL